MHFKIGPLYFSIDGVTENEISKNACKFQTKENKVDIHYTFLSVKELPILEKEWVLSYERSDIKVYQKNGLEARRLAVGNPDSVYAIYQEQSEKEVIIYFLENWKHRLILDTLFISCLALERHLAKKEAYILHCCFTNHHGQAILFSGPSGIGKSTHSDLWCCYIPNTYIVNGDRCMIYKDEKGEYMASAWPVCGSSNICLKETYPLKAIIFMGKGLNNEIRNPHPMQLFRQLSSQITINWWNKTQVTQTLDDLQVMLEKVNMCNYICNLTEEAPTKLHNYLKEKQWIN